MRSVPAFVFLMGVLLFAQPSNNFSSDAVALNDPTKQAAPNQQGEPVIKAWYFDKNGLWATTSVYEEKAEEVIWKSAARFLSSRRTARVIIVRKVLNLETINQDVAHLTRLVAKYGRKGKVVRYYVSPDKDPNIEAIMEPWSYEEKAKNPFEGWDKVQ